MTSLRRLLLDHPSLALWLAIVMLSVKLLVPAGFMVGTADGRVVLQMCSGFGPVAAAPMKHAGPYSGPMAHAGEGGGHHQQPDHPAADMPCPYAALAQGVAPATDPVLLVAAIAFVMALGFAAVVRVPMRAFGHWRPFLRGPPVPS